MPCYICQTTQGPFQKLEVARLRFIRKVHPGFKDNSYMCLRCFRQFDKIYKMKRKENSLNNTVHSASSMSLSTKTASSSNSSQNHSKVTTVRRVPEVNTESSGSPMRLQFNSRTSMDSRSSIDSTDRIVQMYPEVLSIVDSTRKTTHNAELNVARQEAEAAVQSVLRRKRTREESNIPPETPTGTRTDARQTYDLEQISDDIEIASHLSPNDLAHTRPIVRRRKEPVVHQFADIMDVYIARTSGG